MRIPSAISCVALCLIAFACQDRSTDPGNDSEVFYSWAAGTCRCLCAYMIHVVYNNLPGDHYVVRCKVCGAGGCDDPAYLVNVVKFPL